MTPPPSEPDDPDADDLNAAVWDGRGLINTGNGPRPSTDDDW